MADLYVLDTNVYVGALRNRDELQLLKQFLLRAGMRVRVDGIVAMELLAGAGSTEHVDAVRALISPYMLRDWTTAPFPRDEAALSEAAFGKRGGRRTMAPSLANDALLAASCRDAGAVLVTNNTADFTASKD